MSVSSNTDSNIFDRYIMENLASIFRHTWFVLFYLFMKANFH